MDKLTIITNNQPRAVLGWHDLTDKERKEFDYLDSDTAQQDAQFVRYMDSVYDLHEFTVISAHAVQMQEPLAAWAGYQSDSYFSGVVLRWPQEDGNEPDFERVIMGRYYS